MKGKISMLLRTKKKDKNKIVLARGKKMIERGR